MILLGALGAVAWVAFGRPQAGVRTWNERLDARSDDHALTERERNDLERREYYRRMDAELDRRLEEKRRLEGNS